jgi:polyisoprenoid-binding protein YceI
MGNFLAILLLLISTSSFAQKFISEKSKVIFFSEAVLENITATNAKASGIVDLSSQEFAFSIPIKDFQFEKSLMKEHFNEKYMESEKFPKGTFTGKMTGFNNSSTEPQTVVAKGKLTIHGVTREVEITGTIRKIKSSSLSISAKFPIKLTDYNIKIPELLWQKVAEQVEVTAEFSLRLQ